MKKVRLGDITIQMYDGKHGDCKDEENSGYYFISVKDLNDFEINYKNARQITKSDFEANYQRTLLENGDTIYANTGDTIGKSLFVIDNTLAKYTSFQKSIAVIKPDKKQVNPRYLFYLLKYLTPQLRNAATGSSQKNLLLSTMRNFELSIHERKLQNKIASVLGNIDDKILNNYHINNNLEELMQTLYQRWFIEFNFPNEEGKPYKASGGKMVWNEELKQEIPEGWKVENLYKNSLSSIIKNGVDKFEKKIYLETADITNDFISNGNEISFNNRPSRANMQPQLNSIWFAKMKNSVKHLSLAESSNAFVNKYILSTGMYGLQCDKKTFPYMHSFINSIYFESTKDKLAHGATQQAVNDNDIKNIKIICPNNSIIEKYSNKTYSILEEKNLIQEENKRLTELRDFLLPMLMNGQINVDDVEI